MDADASGVVVFTDGTNTLTQSVAANGAYTANLTGFSGAISATLTATDVYGNCAEAVADVTALITPPAAPIVSLSQDTGASASDGITSNPALTVANVPTHGLVEYSLDDATFSTAQPTFATDGSKTVYVETVDQAGNVSTATAFSFTLDTTSPTVAITDAAGDYTDTAASPGQPRTLYGAAEATISGTAGPGASDPALAGATVAITAQIYEPGGGFDPNYPNGIVVGTGIVQADGSWTAQISLPSYSTIVGGVEQTLPGSGSEIEGGIETTLNQFSLTASVADVAGNIGSTQTDYVTGVAPAVTLSLAKQSGPSATNVATLTGAAEGFGDTILSNPYSYDGNLEPGAGLETAVPPGPIEIYDNSTLIDTIAASGTGGAAPFAVDVFDLPGVTIPNGTQTFTAVQTDAAGDVGSASVTVDVLTAPPVVTASLDAGDGPNAAEGYVQRAVIDVSGDDSLPYVYTQNGVVIATSPSFTDPETGDVTYGAQMDSVGSVVARRPDDRGEPNRRRRQCRTQRPTDVRP